MDKSQMKHYECKKCTYYTHNKSHWRRHKLVHSRETPLECEKCEFVCRDVSSLNRHHRRAHSRNKRHKCQKCNYASAIKFDFTNHIRTHSRAKPFECDHCEYKTNSSSHLKRHCATHPGKDFQRDSNGKSPRINDKKRKHSESKDDAPCEPSQGVEAIKRRERSPNKDDTVDSDDFRVKRKLVKVNSYPYLQSTAVFAKQDATEKKRLGNENETAKYVRQPCKVKKCPSTFWTQTETSFHVKLFHSNVKVYHHQILKRVECTFFRCPCSFLIEEFRPGHENSYHEGEPNPNADAIKFKEKELELMAKRRSQRVPEHVLQEQRKVILDEKIRSGHQKGLIVLLTQEKGYGVFALKPFEKGDFVAQYYGDVIEKDEAERREKFYSSRNPFGTGYMLFFKYENKSLCVDATIDNDGRVGRCMNHDKKGNLTPKLYRFDGNPVIILEANRDIEFMDELTFDYGDRRKAIIEDHPWLI